MTKKSVARLLSERWVPAGSVPFPGQQEHEAACVRLGLDPTPEPEREPDPAPAAQEVMDLG